VNVDAGTQARANEPRAGRVRLPDGRAGLLLTFVGLPLLTVALLPLQGRLAVGSFLLIYLLSVVVVAVVGGAWPALLAAATSFLLVNWFLTPPYYTLSVANRDTAVDLVAFFLVAILVSVAVELGARARQTADRHAIEARVLSELGAVELGDGSVTTVLGRVQALFAMDAVALRRAGSEDASLLASVGSSPTPQGQPSLRAPAPGGLELVAWGPELVGQDRQLFATLADVTARAWEGQELATSAARAETLAETDRLRAGLLAAVGHDLRTPLAGIKAATSSLRQDDVHWSEAERAGLLQTIEESADRLSDVIANLLAMSRIQAGALPVSLEPVALDEVVARALMHGTTRPIAVDTPDDLPLVLADAGLLEQVIANLVDNAVRFTAEGDTVEIHGDAPGRGPVAAGPAVARLHVVDHGPGLEPGAWDAVFVPFQRLGDQDTASGLGLGLAIARGFLDAMNGRLEPSSTPGGGLTMTIVLPTAA
jgi:K+-sensing histidine kinase KdpD